MAVETIAHQGLQEDLNDIFGDPGLTASKTAQVMAKAIDDYSKEVVPELSEIVNGVIANGTEVDLTEGSGYLKIGDITGQQLAFDDNEIQSKSDGTTAALLLVNPHGGDVLVGGKVNIASGTETDLTQGSGYLNIGAETGEHISIDTNEIQAKSNDTTASTLFLNPHGGGIDTGGGIDIGGETIAGGKVNITTGTAVALTLGAGYLNIGIESAQHLSFDNNDIQSKLNGTTTSTLFLNPLGGNVEVGDKVKITSGTAVALTLGAGYLNIGIESSQHLSFDNTNIQSKSNGTTAAALFLNPLGGNIEAGGKVNITAGTTVALTSGAGYLNIGIESAQHLSFDNTNIQSKSNGTTAAALFLNPLGGDIDIAATNQVFIRNTTDGSESGSDGALFIGDPAAVHLVIDNNEIIAKSDGTTTSTLNLNIAGGTVAIGALGETVNFKGMVDFDETTLTISGGVITIVSSYHQVDTQGAAGSDNLDTINGGTNGTILFLHTFTSGRDVTLREGVGGNLQLGAATRVLSHHNDYILLIKRDGSTWCEVSFANNS